MSRSIDFVDGFESSTEPTSVPVPATQVSVTPSGNLASTTAQAALVELQSDIDTRATATALTDHVSDATGAHAASAISVTPSGNLAADDVQEALTELQTDIDARATSSALTTHTGNTSNPHSVTAAQVGSATAQWNANKLQGVSISGTVPTTDQFLKYNGTDWIPSSVSVSQSVVSKTSTYTLTASDDVVLASGASFTLTLPTAVGATGKIYRIVKTDSAANIITVNTTSSQTIGGATSTILHAQYEFISVISDGANWQLLTPKERVERALVTATSASVCTVNAQSGNWISATSPGAAGRATLTIRTGVFSSAPTVILTQNTATTPTAAHMAGLEAATTVTSIQFYTGFYNGTAAFGAYPTYVIAIGPR